MPDHASFEELTVLAAGGHLSQQELDDLRGHLAACPECRQDAQVYRDIVSDGLPLTRTATSMQNVSVQASLDAGARNRFLARARREGVEFSSEVDTPASPSSTWRLRTVAGLAVAAAVVLAAIYFPDFSSRVGSGSRASQELERLTSENARLNDALAARERTLVEHQQQLRALQTRLNTAMQSAGGARAVDQQPGLQLGQSRSVEAQLVEELRNRDGQLAAAAEEIERVKQLRVTDRAALAAQGTRLREAFDQLRIANATIDTERELSAAGRDILDLLTAKQLRVVDVRDTDASGRPSAAFARIFIAEGRSIRIFAFDLNEGQNAASTRRFEVWGEQVGQAGSVRSLGVLNVDDRSQNRWRLTVQNADAVKNINSVFVTAAAARGDASDGQRLLYAFLGPTLASNGGHIAPSSSEAKLQ